MIEVIPEIIEVHGRKRVKLTLRDGQTILDADVVDPLNSVARRKVAQRLAERSGDVHSIDRIEQGLLQCVDLIAREEAGAEPARDGEPVTPAPAIDPARVVRGELFVLTNLSGVSAPEVVARGNALSARWRLYLAGADGSRHSLPLEERVTRPTEEGSEPLWIHPLPPPPTLPVAPAWSDAARQRWLGGAAAPKPHAVFAALCDAFDEFVDFPIADANAATSAAPPPAAHSPNGHSPNAHSPNAHSPNAQVLALWTMLTYCFPAWDAVPYLFVNGPAGSGKTRVFELLSRVVFRGFSTSNLSAPALFRTLHERGGTLLLDEAERLLEGAAEVAELRSILLAGYKRGGKASRLESGGDGSFQMTEFAVFGPKAIACISALPGALASRCIPVQMFRSPPTSNKPKLRVDASRSRWSDLRDALHALAVGPLGHAAPVLANQDDACALSGRAYELWHPLLSIAQWLDASAACDPVVAGTWREVHGRIARFAQQLVDGNREETVPEADAVVLRVLCDQVRMERSPTAGQVLDRARHVDMETFRRYTPRRVGEVLKRYGITTARSNGRRVYRDVGLESLRRIERNYSIDLNTSGEDRPDQVQVRLY